MIGLGSLDTCMFCRRGDKTIVNLSAGIHKSCAGGICGGWKFLSNGKSGAWPVTVERRGADAPLAGLNIDPVALYRKVYNRRRENPYFF